MTAEVHQNYLVMYLVLGWVTVCGRVNHFGIQPTRPFILTGSINRVPTSAPARLG